jgi:hypothetical protein
MGFSGAQNVRRRPQGLGVARDIGAPRFRRSGRSFDVLER